MPMRSRAAMRCIRSRPTSPAARPRTANHGDRLTLTAQWDAGSLRYRPPWPMRGFVRWGGAGQRDHARHRPGRDRQLAGLACAVAPQTAHPLRRRVLRPAPHHRPADPDLNCDPANWTAASRGAYHPRPLDMHALADAIQRDRFRSLPVRRAPQHACCLDHTGRIAGGRQDHRGQAG